MWGKVKIWLWHSRDAETLDGDDDDDDVEELLDKLPVDWFELFGVMMLLADDVQEVEEEEEEQVVIVEREFNALVSAVKDAGSLEIVWFAIRACSPSSGVVSVGDDEADVVTDAVVMPMRVVVTIVSINGDDRAVKVVYVGVYVFAVVGVIDPPPSECFFSILLLLSAGADDEPPRHGKQQRNSVDRKVASASPRLVRGVFFY